MTKFRSPESAVFCFLQICRVQCRSDRIPAFHPKSLLPGRLLSNYLIDLIHLFTYLPNKLIIESNILLHFNMICICTTFTYFPANTLLFSSQDSRALPNKHLACLTCLLFTLSTFHYISQGLFFSAANLYISDDFQ